MSSDVSQLFICLFSVPLIFFFKIIIKQTSVRWQHTRGIGAVTEKCGSSPKSWCVSEPDSHSFWPSFCNQAFWHVLCQEAASKTISCSMFDTFSSSIHPSVHPEMLHHRHRESFTKTAKLNVVSVPAPSGFRQQTFRLYYPSGGLGFYMPASTTAE